MAQPTAQFLRNYNNKNLLRYPASKYSSALSNSVTINSTAVDAFIVMHGSQAGLQGGSWYPKVGATPLVETGAAPLPTYRQQGPFGLGVLYKGNATACHRCSTGSAYPITTEDFVVEILFKYVQGTNNEGLIGKFSGTNGWYLCYDSTANKSLLAVTRSTTGAQVVLTGTASSLTSGNFYLVHFMLDRSETTAARAGRLYINGANKGSAAMNANDGITIDQTTSGFTLGGLAGGTLTSASTIYAASVWKQATWFAGGAQNITDMDAFAAARYAALIA